MQETGGENWHCLEHKNEQEKKNEKGRVIRNC